MAILLTKLVEATAFQYNETFIFSYGSLF